MIIMIKTDRTSRHDENETQHTLVEIYRSHEGAESSAGIVTAGLWIN